MTFSNMVTYFIALVFAAVTILFAIMAVKYGGKAKEILKQRKIKSFSAMLTEEGFLKKDGTPQISCSAEGGNVNIIGAFYQVYDPYLTCNKDVVQPLFSSQCDSSCSNKDCTNCSSGECLCCNFAKADGKQVYLNKVCSDTSTTNASCKIRDISPIFSRLCDGKKECGNDVLSWDITNNDDMVNLFGTYPCSLTPSDPQYSNLPCVPASGGGYDSGQTKKGYYIHGIYSCV